MKAMSYSRRWTKAMVDEIITRLDAGEPPSEVARSYGTDQKRMRDAVLRMCAKWEMSLPKRWQKKENTQHTLDGLPL